MRRRRPRATRHARPKAGQVPAAGGTPLGACLGDARALEDPRDATRPNAAAARSRLRAGGKCPDRDGGASRGGPGSLHPAARRGSRQVRDGRRDAAPLRADILHGQGGAVHGLRVVAAGQPAGRAPNPLVVGRPEARNG
jgi:hypothetical protein